ncbi:MAG: hypothetical protein E7293_03365 [Lachnospiraceae bacterium]|nr:hypothetical protein [Lachnospiraceae bacterium]
MKREDLEKLGLAKEQIDSVCDLNNADMQPLKTDLQKAQDDLKVAQEKVTATEETLKKFDGVDLEGLKKQVTDLQADLKKKDDAHAAELADRDFNDLLKESIANAKGKNAKAITALLDVDTLKASKNQKDDIAAALKGLAEAEDSKMLFGEPETVIGGGNPIGTVTKAGNQDSDAAMRAVMGLPPITEQK